MKKTALFALTALLIISLSACSRKNPAPTVLPTPGTMTSPTEDKSTSPTMTLPVPDFTVPNTIGEDGMIHPTDESTSPSKSTESTIEEGLRRGMPRK